MIVAKRELLRRLRIERGLTKSGLAREVGVSHSSIVRAERQAGVSPQTAKGICDYFGVEFKELFDIV